MLSVVTRPIVLSVVMLGVVMLSVVMLSVVILSVVASIPEFRTRYAFTSIYFLKMRLHQRRFIAKNARASGYTSLGSMGIAPIRHMKYPL